MGEGGQLQMLFGCLILILLCTCTGIIIVPAKLLNGHEKWGPGHGKGMEFWSSQLAGTLLHSAEYKLITFNSITWIIYIICGSI